VHSCTKPCPILVCVAHRPALWSPYIFYRHETLWSGIGHVSDIDWLSVMQNEVPKDQVKDYSKFVVKKDEMWLAKIEAKAKARPAYPQFLPSAQSCLRSWLSRVGHYHCGYFLMDMRLDKFDGKRAVQTPALAAVSHAVCLPGG